ncbi:hypothetical protein AAHE18_09G032900 [Arachis hypogaea]
MIQKSIKITIYVFTLFCLFLPIIAPIIFNLYLHNHRYYHFLLSCVLTKRNLNTLRVRLPLRRVKVTSGLTKIASLSYLSQKFTLIGVTCTKNSSIKITTLGNKLIKTSVRLAPGQFLYQRQRCNRKAYSIHS